MRLGRSLALPRFTARRWPRPPEGRTRRVSRGGGESRMERSCRHAVDRNPQPVTRPHQVLTVVVVQRDRRIRVLKKSPFKTIVYRQISRAAAFFAASVRDHNPQTSIISSQVLGAMHPDLSRILTLPLPDQIQVVQDLWDRISDSGQPLPIPEWQCRELDQHRRPRGSSSLG